MAWLDLTGEVAELFGRLSCVPEVRARDGFFAVGRERDAEQKEAHAAEERARYARNLEKQRAYRREQKRKQYAANPEKERARKRHCPTKVTQAAGRLVTLCY